MKLRIILLTVAMAGCATKGPVLTPNSAYIVTEKSAPLYAGKPKKDAQPEMNLKEKTVVVLVKQDGPYSLVKLTDKSVGFVSTSSLAPAPESALKKASASTTPKKKAAAKPSPTPGQDVAEPEAVPKPTPKPEPQVETPGPEPETTPQFRY